MTRHAAALLLTLSLLALGAARAEERVALVSGVVVDPATPNGLPGCKPQSSQDGRYVAICSDATNLVTGVLDSNNAPDFFVHDRQTGTTVLASHALGEPLRAVPFSTLSEENSDLALSADGGTLLFVHDAPGLTAEGGNGQRQLYRFDVASGDVALVSRAAATAVPASGQVRRMAVSADGQWIAYTSDATDLLPGQSAGAGEYWNVFLHHAESGATRLVSHAPGLALQGSGSGTEVQVSADGRYVLFLRQNVAVRYDRDTDTFVTVSHAAAQPAQTRFATRPSLSADGAHVLFVSESTDLVAGQTDTNAGLDLFLWSAATDSVRLISHRDGAPLTAGDRALTSNMYEWIPYFAMSDDVRRFVFTTAATDYDLANPDVNGALDVVYRDLDAGTVKRLAGVSGPNELVAASRSLQTIAIGADLLGSVIHRPVAGTSITPAALVAPGLGLPDGSGCSAWSIVGESPVLACDAPLHGDEDRWMLLLAGDDDVVQPFPLPAPAASPEQAAGGYLSSGEFHQAISSEGSRVAFTMGREVWLRDRQAPARRLPRPEIPAADYSSPVGVWLSGTGRRMFVQWYFDGEAQLFAYDLDAQTAAPIATPAASFTELVLGISHDGKTLLLMSPRDFSGGLNAHRAKQLYLWRDGVPGLSLVTRRPAAAGGQASQTQGFPFAYLSADGRHVAFESDDGTLGGYLAGGNEHAQIYLHDTSTGHTRLVSHLPDTSTPLPETSSVRGLSDDGGRVLFATAYAQVVPGVIDENQRSDLFLYETGSDSVRLVTHRHDQHNRTLSEATWSGRLSASGRWIALDATHDDLVPGSGSVPHDQVFLLDVDHDTWRILTRDAQGAYGNAESFVRGISAAGEAVLIGSSATNLAAPSSPSPGGSLHRWWREDERLQLVTHLEDEPDVVAPTRFAGRAQLSANGRTVLFDRGDNGMDARDANWHTTDVYRADRFGVDEVFFDGMEGF